MQPDLTALMEKYISGSITANEQLRLLELLKKEENRLELNRMIDAAMNHDKNVTSESHPLNEISFQLLEEKIGAVRSRRRSYMIAAAAVLVISCTVVFWQYSKPRAERQIASVQAEAYTRHLILPDSSIVVLHANSTIQLMNGFNTDKREITLTGEAYFDVRHNATKPFVVHTGPLKTTVLGTAFNISAWPGIKQVTVAVTKGKVRVEDAGKTVATLTPNNQVTYSLQNESASEQPVDAGHVVTDWTKKELVFESISFKEIAAILSKRYSVSIQFSNEALMNCHIRTSCKGTESLNEMLDLLCTAMNASYSINNNEVMISGDGCE